tara:strand:- start:9931 stop:11214 length:1284 start_codon:yes stop_codon:yes gene_type:complete
MEDFNAFFRESMRERDPELASVIVSELQRQQNQIELIASENIVSKAVLEACGSVMTNKYAEGYPGRRYYGGCEHVDVAEDLAISRVKQLLDCRFANVQPHSGSQANFGVYQALLKPGDTLMGMSLDSGGHLTHGARPNQSGKWFNAVQYGVRQQDGRIDYDAATALAQKTRPKIIIAGGSAYPREIDFEKFREIANSVGAYFMVDMAHFAGLVAGGVYPSPVPIADVITFTTHKTLRGPRGGAIVTNDEAIAKKVNSAIFPGIQGGPLMHIIAAKAVAFGEALRPEFKSYARAVIDNAEILAATLNAGGLDIVTGGTDTHVVLVDLRPLKLTGRDSEAAMERSGLTCNKNAVPFDPAKPMITSGVRLGSPAATSRGFGQAEFKRIGELILQVLNGLAGRPEEQKKAELDVRRQVEEMCKRFPIYPRY